MSKSEYGEFRRLVMAHLATTHPGATWDGESQTISADLSDELRLDVNLARLAAILADAELHLWAPVIADFLGATANIGSESLPAAWADAAELLTAKIYPAHALEHHNPDDFFLRPVTDELVALLMVDIAQTRWAGLRRIDAGRWDTPEDELWARAISNVHAQVPLTVDRIALAEGGYVRSFHSHHRQAVSHVLELESHVESTAPNGVLVGIPHENAFLIHELLDDSARGAAEYISSAAAELFVGSPNTGMTPIAYWWRAGLWQPLTRVVGDHLENLMPPAFVELLETLGARRAATNA